MKSLKPIPVKLCLKSHLCEVLTDFVETLLFHPQPTAQTGLAPDETTHLPRRQHALREIVRGHSGLMALNLDLYPGGVVLRGKSNPMRISGLTAGVTFDLDSGAISAPPKFMREIAPKVTQRVAASWCLVPCIAGTAVHRGSNGPL
jgi:hypothetical protein